MPERFWKQTRNWLAFGAGLLGGLGLALLVGERLGLGQTIPHSRDLRGGLAAFYRPAEVEGKMDSITRRYRQLLAQTPPRANPALQKHIRETILVGLALYRELQPGCDTLEAARERTRQVLEIAYGFWLRTPMRLLDKLTDPYPLFRRAVHWRMETDFPAEGFQTEWLQDDEQAVAFNLHTCLYLDVLRQHGAEELTPVFCAMDDMMMEGVDFISWDRTQTQGLGAEFCDFRWTRR